MHEMFNPNAGEDAANQALRDAVGELPPAEDDMLGDKAKELMEAGERAEREDDDFKGNLH